MTSLIRRQKSTKVFLTALLLTGGVREDILVQEWGCGSSLCAAYSEATYAWLKR